MNRSNDLNAPDPHAEEAGREALERQRLLGTRLRTLFSDVASEPLPGELAGLLARLPEGAAYGER
jgi:hypothetical protein